MGNCKRVGFVQYCLVGRKQGLEGGKPVSACLHLFTSAHCPAERGSQAEECVI